MKYFIVFIMLLASLAGTALAGEPVQNGCKSVYKTMPSDMLNNLLGRLHKAHHETGKETYSSGHSRLEIKKVNDCTLSVEYLESGDLLTCSERIEVCTNEKIKPEELTMRSRNSGDIKLRLESEPGYAQYRKKMEEKEALYKIKENNTPEEPESAGDHIELLVSIDDNTNEDSVVSEIINGKGEVVKKGNPYLPNIIKVKVHKNDKNKHIERLKQHPNVKSIEIIKNFKLESNQVTPNDTYFINQWYLNKIGMPAAWAISRGSSSIVVAVIDTGVGPNSDLSSNLVPGFNTFTNQANTSDMHGHGTAVAAIVGSVGNNGSGIAGMSWQGSIMPIVACDAGGECPPENIAAGIRWAVNNGANVVNMSFSSDTESMIVTSAINYAYSRDVVLVAAAGNQSGTAKRYPAASTNVIAVGGITETDTLTTGTDGSNYGSWVDVSAPGQNIYTLIANEPIPINVTIPGTSLSAPQVSGLAALILTTNRNITNDYVRYLIHTTASTVYLSPDGTVSSLSGRINADKALVSVLSTATKDGDLNSDRILNVVDAIFAIQIVVGNRPLTDSYLKHGDIFPMSDTGLVNSYGKPIYNAKGDGFITISDALSLLSIVIDNIAMNNSPIAKVAGKQVGAFDPTYSIPVYGDSSGVYYLSSYCAAGTCTNKPRIGNIDINSFNGAIPVYSDYSGRVYTTSPYCYSDETGYTCLDTVLVGFMNANAFTGALPLYGNGIGRTDLSNGQLVGYIATSAIENINAGATSTKSQTVNLTLSCNSGCINMKFSNDNTIWSQPETYATSKTWVLIPGDGNKTVYTKFQNANGIWLDAVSNSILLDTTSPTSTPTVPGGLYNTTQSVTLTCNDGLGSGCDRIYYTTDGTTPSTSSAIYLGPLSILATTTLKYFANDLVGNSETVKTDTYIIQSGGGTNYTENFDAVTTVPSGWSAQGSVSISPMYHSTTHGLLLGDGSFTDGSVSFVAPTTGSFSFWYYKSGAWGYYWDWDDWTQYGTNAGAMTVSVNGTVVYTVTADTGWVKTPLFSVHAGDTIRISQTGNHDDGGEACEYGCNEGDDRYDNISVYIDDISILGGASSDTTVPVTSASPGGNTYVTAQAVTLSANEPAAIYYTTNGTTPTTSSAVYATPLSISATTTLKYFARDLSGNIEAVKTQTYIIDSTAATTTASPLGGTYSSPQSVTLSANESATIYYTTNGATPTTSSAIYSVPLTIATTTTLKFFARDSVGNAEPIKTQTYVIQSGGSSYAENFDAVSALPSGWSAQGPASISPMNHSATHGLLLGDGSFTDGSVSFVAPATGSFSFWYYKSSAWGYYWDWNLEDFTQYGTNAGATTVSVNGTVVYSVTADTGWVKTPLFSVHAGDTIRISQTGNHDDGGEACEYGCNEGDDRYDNISVYIDDINIGG